MKNINSSPLPSPERVARSLKWSWIPGVGEGQSPSPPGSLWHTGSGLNKAFHNMGSGLPWPAAPSLQFLGPHLPFPLGWRARLQRQLWWRFSLVDVAVDVFSSWRGHICIGLSTACGRHSVLDLLSLPGWLLVQGHSFLCLQPLWFWCSCSPH